MQGGPIFVPVFLRQNPFNIRPAYSICRVNTPFLQLVALVNEPLGAVISGFDLVQVIRDGLLGEVAARWIAMFIVQIVVEADDIRHAMFFDISHELTVRAHNIPARVGGLPRVVQEKLSHWKLIIVSDSDTI